MDPIVITLFFTLGFLLGIAGYMIGKNDGRTAAYREAAEIRSFISCGTEPGANH